MLFGFDTNVAGVQFESWIAPLTEEGQFIEVSALRIRKGAYSLCIENGSETTLHTHVVNKLGAVRI